MKKLMKKLWQDESAQGMSEYVLLIMVVVAILFIFRDKIKGIVSDKMDQVGSEIGGFSGN